MDEDTQKLNDHLMSVMDRMDHLEMKVVKLKRKIDEVGCEKPVDNVDPFQPALDYSIDKIIQEAKNNKNIFNVTRDGYRVVCVPIETVEMNADEYAYKL